MVSTRAHHIKATSIWVWLTTVIVSSAILFTNYEGGHLTQLLITSFAISSAHLMMKVADFSLPYANTTGVASTDRNTRIEVSYYLGLAAAISLSGFGYFGALLAASLVAFSSYLGASGFVRSPHAYIGRQAGLLGVAISICILTGVANFGDRPVISLMFSTVAIMCSIVLMGMRKRPATKYGGM